MFSLVQRVVLHEYSVFVLVTTSIRKNKRQTKKVTLLSSSTMSLGQSHSFKFDMKWYDAL